MPGSTTRVRPEPRALPRRRRRTRPVPRLLVDGNRKLGPLVKAWSIPAGATCPGKTQACVLACYAMQGHFTSPGAKIRHLANYDRSREPGFASRMVREIRETGPRTVRIHVAGDFYSAEYAGRWLEIARRCPETTLFFYTRSYRVPEIRHVLRQLARLPNVHAWYSGDRDTGLPPRDPGVRIAWMLSRPDEEPLIPVGVDLVFRVREDRIAKTLNGIQVCPYESGITQAKVTCSRCRICFRPPRPPRKESEHGQEDDRDDRARPAAQE